MEMPLSALCLFTSPEAARAFAEADPYVLNGFGQRVEGTGVENGGRSMAG